MANSLACLILDPICGMWLTPHQIAATYIYMGQRYAFCCTECRDLFARAPEVHVLRLAHEPEQGAGYRCPCQRAAVERERGSDRVRSSRAEVRQLA